MVHLIHTSLALPTVMHPQHFQGATFRALSGIWWLIVLILFIPLLLIFSIFLLSKMPFLHIPRISWRRRHSVAPVCHGAEKGCGCHFQYQCVIIKWSLPFSNEKPIIRQRIQYNYQQVEEVFYLLEYHRNYRRIDIKNRSYVNPAAIPLPRFFWAAIILFLVFWMRMGGFLLLQFIFIFISITSFLPAIFVFDFFHFHIK